ncbi:MAG: hypothetical protein GY940_03010 [bacterium]|nr:hypothetical protein [bacterium]
MSTDVQTVKKIIKDELPQMIKNDQGIKELIVQLSGGESKTDTEKTLKVETGPENRLAGIIGQLKTETEYQSRVLEDNYKEIERMREEIIRNQKEIESIHRLLNAFDRKQDISLGTLQMVYGY